MSLKFTAPINFKCLNWDTLAFSMFDINIFVHKPLKLNVYFNSSATYGFFVRVLFFHLFIEKRRRIVNGFESDDSSGGSTQGDYKDKRVFNR